ncbi:MAG: DUF3341 domain-containing protein [Candidatus Abyssobacteria bacterium SURF_5]|uniref:DUF3341 domain-containing protein n=1 Tax=Abyssobacteria bacterium (strain SURF_5) TaxID=2093360 RepID=A0A3A4P148_ABYX5|nr:MAG: DUF3341 domain-containing protein [Candidatus Abyssubacteria bacterium SURF_5]
MSERCESIAIYSTAEALARAVQAAQSLNMEIIDICSPIPLPEMEELVPRRPSQVRWFALIGCLTGAAFGLWLQIYTVLSWPIPVGGKPIVSLSAFVVIAFELTILFGATATFAGFLFTSRLPRIGGIYHPGCSQNEFALVVRHESPQCEKVHSALKNEGTLDVRLLEGEGRG